MLCLSAFIDVYLDTTFYLEYHSYNLETIISKARAAIHDPIYCALALLLMASSDHNSPTAVLLRFYEAERRYMRAGGKSGGASFDEFAATMAYDVVLHQSPDLPWGGEYHGIERYAEWGAIMSDCFQELDVQDAQFFENGNQVVVSNTLVTKSRKTGEIMRRPMVHVVTVVDGKIKDFRPFYWHVPDYIAAHKGELANPKASC